MSSTCQTCSDEVIDNDYPMLSCNPATGLTAKLLSPSSITATDLSIRLYGGATLPCCGYILFDGCRGNKEILFYSDVEKIDVLSNHFKIKNVQGGLDLINCGFSPSSDRRFTHTITENILVASPQIHHYHCHLMLRQMEIEQASCRIYNSLDEVADCEECIKMPIIVNNNGTPELYVRINGEFIKIY